MILKKKSIPIIKLSSENFSAIVVQAAQIIKAGGICLLPFDTVYGFLCDAANTKAIDEIISLKSRDPKQKTFGLAVASIDSLKKLTGETKHSAYIKKHIPGKYTFVLPAKEEIVLDQRCLRNQSVAIRVPDSKLVLSILDKFSCPAAQTSANKSGSSNCCSFQQVQEQFSCEELSRIELVIDGGEVTHCQPSELIDLTGDTPRILPRN